MSIPQHKTRVRIHGWTQRFKKFAFLLLLGTVLVSLTAATANVASAANATAPPSVGATTHPIQYWIGCAPSMATTATLTYFKQQGFTAVCLVVPDSQTYQTQLNTIKSLNMLPIIDIEMPIWAGGQLQGTPINSFAGYFQSLKNAGWQYVASEGGRTGDLSYMKQYFKGYVNFNCDQCGLWKNMYTDPFTVANSWESYYPYEWQYIQTGATQAAARGIKNGLLAGTWANIGGDNQIYANSLSGSGTPSYLSMLNWSYANGIGFTSFHVWCGDNPGGLTQYKNLGFDKIVARMQVYYPASTSASFGTGTGVTRQPTQLSLTPSSTAPSAGQSTTFSGTLTQGSTRVANAKVNLHVSTDDKNWKLATATTATTNANGAYTFSGTLNPGTYYFRSYYPGSTQYRETFSSVSKVTVSSSTTRQLTQLSLTLTPSAPIAGQSTTFSGTLRSRGTLTPISLASATVYLHVSSDNAHWSTAWAPTTTNAAGGYTLRLTLKSGHTYYFRTYYPGSSQYRETFSSTVRAVVK